MTEYTVTGRNAEDDARAIRGVLEHLERIGVSSSAAGHLAKFADSIEEQVKPVDEGPSGDVVVWSRGAWWVKDAGGWYAESYGASTWSFVVGGDPDSFTVYRKETSDPVAEWESDLFNAQHRRDTAAAVLAAIDVDQYLIDAVRNASPQTDDGAGALLDSNSPEPRVATSPPAPSSPEDRHWWVCKDVRSRVKVAGPFRDRDEAVENRARIEEYTGNLTFWVNEVKP